MSYITTTEFVPAWDAGARSIITLSGDGCAYWRAGQDTGIICGFSNLYSNSNYLEIKNAFYIASGKYRVIESGAFKTTLTFYPIDAVFKVERIKNTVYYYVNDVLVYTSLISLTGTILVECSLYYYNDSIVGLDIEDYSVDDPTFRSPAYLLNSVILSGSFSPIVGFLVEENLNIVRGNFSPLTGSLTGLDSAKINREFKPLTGKLLEATIDTLYGNFEPITGKINEVWISPEVNSLFGQFSPIQGKLYEYSNNASLQGEFKPIIGKLKEEDVAVLYGAFQPITGTLLSGLQNYFILSWPRWNFTLREWDDDSWRAFALFDWPAFEGTAATIAGDNTALFQWPAFGGSAHAGAQALFDWPAIEGESAATNPGFAAALFDWPAFEGEFTAFTGQVANATFNWPGLTGEAYSGGAVLFDWPSFAGDGTTTVGAVANALFDWPAIEGESSATVFGTASVLFDWPAFEGEAGDGIHVLFDWPAFAGAASVTHAVVTADAETYAINLSTGAVTQLLLGPLDKLVTAYGNLYVLRDGELLILAGDNDGMNGENPIPIPVTVRFAQQNFGILNTKRCSVVYLNAREDDGVILDLVQDERTTWRYLTPTDTAPAMGTHRVKVGRGVKFHTLGVVIQNREGGRLDIGGMELFVQPLIPRPKT